VLDTFSYQGPNSRICFFKSKFIVALSLNTHVLIHSKLIS
jgi:hypothetical protein